MIELRINGEALDLGPDFSIQIEMASPLFSDVIGYSSHSLKFRLPLTPRNQRILEHADSVLQYGTVEAYDVDTYLFGQRWRSGLLNLESFAMDSISAALDLSEARFSRLLRDKSLQDYSYGGTRVITAPGGNDLVPPVTTVPGNSPIIDHANATTAGSIDTHDYVFFPVYNETMYAGNYRRLSGALPEEYEPWTYLNWWRIDQDGFWDEMRQAISVIFGPVPSKYEPWGRHPLVPFPYLVYVLRQLALENGYSLDDSSGFLSDDEIRTLTMVNPVTLDRLYDFEFNAFSSAAWYSTSSHAETIELGQHMSTDNSRDFWIQISRLFGLATIVDDAGVRLVLKKDHANALNQIDWRKKVLSYSHHYSGINRTYGTNARTGDSLESATITNDEAGAVAEVDTVTSLPVSGVEIETVYFVQDENAYYKYELIQGSQPAVYVWNFLGYRTEKVVVGTGSENYQNEIGSTQPHRGDWLADSDVYGNQLWDVPKIDMPLISVPYNQPPYDFGAKLCFYRGMKENQGGYEYPYGSSDADIAAGHNYSLRWHGAGNLYDTWHKPWVEMLEKSRQMKLYLNLNLADILELDWLKKPRIRVADGEAVCLLKTLTIKITSQGLEMVEADAIRI